MSFAVIDPADPTEIESLTLLRTPKYEHLPADWERGVSVSFERYVEDDDELLEELHLDRRSAVVRLTTSLRNYELDLRKVDEKEVKAMRKVLSRMNHDRRIRLLGIYRVLRSDDHKPEVSPSVRTVNDSERPT